MSEMTCRCGARTRNDASLCDKHAAELTQALSEVPFLVEQLEVSITRQRSAGNAGDSGETGLPWDESASDAQRGLHATLHTWVRFCAEEHVRHQSPNLDLPTDDAKAMSRWMLWRVDGLTLHELGPDAWEEITNAAAEARRVVFRKPQPRIYLGACTVSIDGEECGHAIYAIKGGETGQCIAPDCRQEYPVAESQAALEKELDSRLCTAAEIAHLTTYLGLDVPRERVRKQINAWHKRKQINAKSVTDSGDPRFTYGEVRPLLAAAYQHAKEAM